MRNGKNSSANLLASAPTVCVGPRRLTGTQLRCDGLGSRHGVLLKASRIALVERVQDVGEAIPILDENDACLRSWISNHGGLIHRSIRLVVQAPCGCRGVITTTSLPLDFVRSNPLIVVPERLYMSIKEARTLLQKLDSKRFNLSFWRQELTAVVQLALLLAVEKKRGDDSFWAPYIRSLPTAVPCGWALPQSELQRLLAALGPLAENWAPAVVAARAGVHRHAELAVQRYGKHVPGSLCTEDMIWAMGQVLSRCFGRDPDLGLAPYIDLCNHRHGAPKPSGYLDEQTGLSYAYIDSSRFDQPRPLAAGDEVYVSYAAGGGDPLAAFLNLGFVPPELLTAVKERQE